MLTLRVCFAIFLLSSRTILCASVTLTLRIFLLSLENNNEMFLHTYTQLIWLHYNNSNLDIIKNQNYILILSNSLYSHNKPSFNLIPASLCNIPFFQLAQYYIDDYPLICHWILPPYQQWIYGLKLNLLLTIWYTY